MRDMNGEKRGMEERSEKEARREGDSRRGKGQTVSMMLNEGQEDHVLVTKCEILYHDLFFYLWLSEKKSSFMSCSLVLFCSCIDHINMRLFCEV